MWIVLLTLLFAIAACDAASEALPDAAPAPTDAQALTADASLPDGPWPTHPLVTGIGVPAHPAGVVALAITVRDTTSPAVALMLLHSCDGAATWAPATTLDPLTALATSATGTTHTIRWDAPADVDLSMPRACFVAAIATDPGGLSSETVIAQVVFGDGGSVRE